MVTNLTAPALPAEDRRWKIVNATMRRLGYSKSALIETLHTVQETFGYLDDVSLRFVAKTLRVPLSRAYGVATFYHFFNLKPQGKHTCVVCMGTACYIKGAGQLVEAVEKAYSVKAGDTTADGELSLLTARCIGCCAMAAAAVFDGETIGKLAPDETLKHIRRTMSHDAG
jgi:bidirectional [NiFe] hydrogenase diaphorase subunit